MKHIDIIHFSLSELHCFHLTSEECLFKLDLGQNLASVSHLFCKVHSNISINDDFLVISLIDEVYTRLKVVEVSTLFLGENQTANLGARGKKRHLQI